MKKPKNLKKKYVEVGKRIKSRMKKLGYTQSDIVSMTGASTGAVSLWVNGGSKPQERYLNRLADILETEAKWLLEGDIAIEPSNTDTDLNEDNKTKLNLDEQVETQQTIIEQTANDAADDSESKDDHYPDTNSAGDEDEAPSAKTKDNEDALQSIGGGAEISERVEGWENAVNADFSAIDEAAEIKTDSGDSKDDITEEKTWYFEDRTGSMSEDAEIGQAMMAAISAIESAYEGDENEIEIAGDSELGLALMSIISAVESAKEDARKIDRKKAKKAEKKAKKKAKAAKKAKRDKKRRAKGSQASVIEIDGGSQITITIAVN